MQAVALTCVVVELEAWSLTVQAVDLAGQAAK